MTITLKYRFAHFDRYTEKEITLDEVQEQLEYFLTVGAEVHFDKLEDNHAGF